MMKKSLCAFIPVLLFFNSGTAQNSTNNNAALYRRKMNDLQTTIQLNFYDTASGYYKETAVPAKDQNPYSYLWPVCAMFQAANEIEKVDAGKNLLQPMLVILRDYYDPAPPKPGYASYITKLKGGDRFYDDNQWIGITAMDAYARTKDKQYLQLGQEIYQYMMTGFDTVSGGGLYWQENKRTSKNTCSNGPGIVLALQLYQSTKKRGYLDTALLLYNWVNNTLKSPSGLYYDNIGIKTRKTGKAIFSYNTGTMLQSNVYLYECTGDKSYLKKAAAIADSSIAFFYRGETFRDNYWFNAVLLRAYQHLLKYNKDTRYILAFEKCLDGTLQREQNSRGLFAKDKLLDLVAHGGMLEILARFALLETRYALTVRPSH